MTDHKQPLQTFRAGGVKASVWLNKGSENRPFMTVTIVRSYRDKNDEWKETTSYGRDDLPKVRLVSDQAYEYIFARAPEIGKDDPDSGHVDRLNQEREKGGASAAKTGK